MQTKHMVAGNLPKEAEAEEKKKTLRIFKGKIRPKKMLKIIKISKKHAKTWGTRFGVMSAVMDFLPRLLKSNQISPKFCAPRYRPHKITGHHQTLLRKNSPVISTGLVQEDSL